MNNHEQAQMRERIRPAFKIKMREEQLADDLEESLLQTYLSVADWVHRQKAVGKPLLLGVNGAQGSGKSTLCRFLQLILAEAYQYKVIGFSIDDLYLTRAERQRLGQEIHPLLVTRGVPGTHDISLGQRILRALFDPTGKRVALPVFDKALDDRRPPAEWPIVDGPADIVIFEGWCVGAKPQAEMELVKPVNGLELEEDPDGIWRTYVNRQLQGSYASLFDRIDRLILLKVPSMDCVYQWRSLQEQKLAEKTASTTYGSHIMDDTAMKRFIMHYERITRHVLAEMPERADLTLSLDHNHQFTNPDIHP